MSRLQSFDPATGAVVGEVEVTPVDAVHPIVDRARRAQGRWAETPIEGRIARLEPAARRLDEMAGEIGALATLEMGKPIIQAIAEVRSCAERMVAEMAEIAAAVEPEVFEDRRTHSVVYHDALGVCAAITPWNYPVSMPHWLVLPALVTGNAVVLKPSEETPLTGQAYVDIFASVLPEGVLQIVQGADEQGRALVRDDVDLIAFTGSREVGKQIFSAASSRLKRVILELGGKDPLIVLEDADLRHAARFAARSSFENSGQTCVSSERIYVPRLIAPRFVELLVEAAMEWLPLGPGLDPETRLGPLVNSRQRDHVLSQIDEAVTQGAEIVFGGRGHSGNFVVPTVLTGVTPEMGIAREETFGPVACVTVVADVAEAVKLANDSPFGLGAVVLGTDEERTRSVARSLTAGMIGVNRPVGGVPGTPWVGARESGYGFHHSRDGHRHFTQTRLLSSRLPA